ncbi:cupin domain-containing protein [Maricurvus nonylphenolicus]|uniref:cupin domain-containing protein n=1 Tax=Maricurvus nonylphenolicus TaxID=1008307 RepID=UPI0036F32250
MAINADFAQRVVVHSEQMDWQASPMAGVARRPLDRVGGEVARATTIVRYEPGSHFSPHIHHGGEEFIVLSGTFQDEHGDYPAGSYIRNPPSTQHTPSAEDGCIIFVKLWQFEPADRTSVNRLIHSQFASISDYGPNIVSQSLFSDDVEKVQVLFCEPHCHLQVLPDSGIELLVLEGSLVEAGDHLLKHSWLRLPVGQGMSAKIGEQGARLWLKTGHLGRVGAEIQRVQASL